MELEPCFMKDKAEPHLIIATTHVPNSQPERRGESSDMLWVCSRALLQNAKKVPPWTGWVSSTESSMEDSSQESIVDYMVPVFIPITENTTVQHILKIPQETSWKVGQPYTFVTFDLAIVKKAYALLWQNPQVFRDVIVRLGGFHLICSYMSALGTNMRCSGFEEILVELVVCASGSIEKVMTVKHYNEALHVHKLVLEALDHLLLHVFESAHGGYIR